MPWAPVVCMVVMQLVSGHVLVHSLPDNVFKFALNPACRITQGANLSESSDLCIL